jgi:hypothetical protein
MAVVIASALVLSPFAWTAPRSRWWLFIVVSTVGSIHPWLSCIHRHFPPGTIFHEMDMFFL